MDHKTICAFWLRSNSVWSISIFINYYCRSNLSDISKFVLFVLSDHDGLDLHNTHMFLTDPSRYFVGEEEKKANHRPT